MPLHGICNQHDASVNHIPLIPGHFVDVVGDESAFRDTYGLEQGLLPEAASSFQSSDCIHNTKR